MRIVSRTRGSGLSEPSETGTGLAVALVADDLTGALDAAAPFAGRGLRVKVHRSPDTLPAPDGGTDGPSAPGHARPGATISDGSGAVLAVSTSSRHLAPAAARAVVEAAARRLLAWTPRLVFKKVDSTLRGPVPDEVAAAMEVFGRRSALVCPAFPAAGRVVRDGEVFVYGEPLRETEYAHDLRTPAPAESLEALFARIGAVRRLRPGESLPGRLGGGIVIADAETEAHLTRLAALVAEHERDVLAVGSDGLAAGLASLFGTHDRPARLAGGAGRIVLFVLGSRVGTTAEQAGRLVEANPGLPVVEAPAGGIDAEAVARAADSARAVVLRVPASPRGEPDTVVRSFAAGVRSAIERLGGPGRLAALVATGGDTVEALLDAFDIASLDVLGEFRPGIPVSRGAAPGGAALTLVSKAGGFGTPELFAELVAETAAP